MMRKIIVKKKRNIVLLQRTIEILRYTLGQKFDSHVDESICT